MVFKNPKFNDHREKREMSVALRFTNFLSNVGEKIMTAIILIGYSDMTIASYFRKQGARIGEHCLICVRSLGSEPYLVSIGNHVFISGGTVFNTHDGAVWVFQDKDPDIRVFGTIAIEDNCVIGRNVMLLPNIRIGRNSIVGAGSVVISDVPPNSIVMGVPARAISSISKYEERCFATWKEQRPPDLDLGKGLEWWSSKEYKRKVRRHLTNLFKDQGKPGEEAEK